MKLTQIGGATAILEHHGVRILFDPWLDDGIFHGSWFHFPPLKTRIEELGRFDYIYISHIHEDHCSAGTIRHLNRDAEILLMDRRPNFVAKFLEANAFGFRKVHLVKPRTPLALSPTLTVDMIEPDTSNEMSFLIDSMLVLSWDGRVVFNANDCQPWEGSNKYLEENYPRIDLALLPYAGGSGYPACYSNLDDDMKRVEIGRIRTSRAKGFVETVRRLKPVRAMPFADQYVIGGSRRDRNRFVSHPPGPGYVRGPMTEAGLADTLLLLNPAQSIDLDTGAITPAEPFADTDEVARARYVETLSTLYDHEKITFSPMVSIERLVRSARERLWAEQKRRGETPAWKIYLDTGAGTPRFCIALDREEVDVLSPDSPMAQPFLRIRAPHTLMAFLLLGHVSWNIADAALFLDYERVPNQYEPSIYALLNFLKA